MEERVERLESEIALQDRAMEKLQTFVDEQQRQIVLLEDKVELLTRKVLELQAVLESGVPAASDPPPPHYGR